VLYIEIILYFFNVILSKMLNMMNYLLTEINFKKKEVKCGNIRITCIIKLFSSL